MVLSGVQQTADQILSVIQIPQRPAAEAGYGFYGAS